ncbi:phosphoribosylanthranilate isomerase [Planctomycetota bacterium]|nr:phosphoribosylanthranilate isomerase [Planctomycetota bacterium]
MSRTRIKICGITDEETALVAVEAGADAIGLVFVEKSPRNIDVPTAKKIVKALPPLVEPIGLFVDEAPEHVRHIAQQVGLRTVQLHGRETIEYVTSLDDLHILKAVTFSSSPDKTDAIIDEWKNPPRHLVGLLWDAAPNGDNSGLLGGTGQAFDWDALAELQAHGNLEHLPKLILAGGLTPENVGEAIATIKPYAVDVSSGVESSRGIKDHELIKQFCIHAQKADAQFA